MCPGESADYNCPSLNGIGEVRARGTCSEGGKISVVEITDFCPQIPACKLPEVADGSLHCSLNPDSDFAEAGEECFLICAMGFLPTDSTRATTCVMDKGTGQYFWDKDDFTCEPQIGVVIGGITPSVTYSSNVELMNMHDDSCKALPEYPIRVAGAVAGTVAGRLVVCGGATQSYAECKDARGYTK